MDGDTLLRSHLLLFHPLLLVDWFVPLLFFVAPVSAPACTVDGTVVYVRTYMARVPSSASLLMCFFRLSVSVVIMLSYCPRYKMV
jgi:hypothetical protein